MTFHKTILLFILQLLIQQSSSTTSLRPHHHLINNVITTNQYYDPKKIWTPQLVPNCILHSGTQRVFAVEMRTPTYSNVWERQFRLSSLPTEIQSRVRCKDWSDTIDSHLRLTENGGQGPSPPTSKCEVDHRYFVGSKRTMLACLLGLRPLSFFNNANVLILGLGGGSMPMQLGTSLFPKSKVTTIELDKAVVTLARSCFGFPSISIDSNLRVVVDDAVSYVNEAAKTVALNKKDKVKNDPGNSNVHETYNLIINDIANNMLSSGPVGGNVHDALHSLEFFSNIVQLLQPNGIFIMNQRQNIGTDTDELSTLSGIEENMKKAGFGTTRALLNDKVSRSILIGSLKKGETFDLIQVLRGNCEQLGLVAEKGEQWRDVNVLVEELSAFV